MNPLGLHRDGMRPTILRPANLSTPSKLIDGRSWSVYEGAPSTHYASGTVPAASIGAYTPSGTFFAGKFEGGELKAIMEFIQPSTSDPVGIAASNIRKLILPCGPRVYIGDSVFRSLDCTIRIKLISEDFDGTLLTWDDAPAADASPAFTLTLNGASGGHIGLVQSQVALHIDGDQLDQTKTFYGLEMSVDTSFIDNGVPTNFIEPHGWWAASLLGGILRGMP